jgi:hypothetical protein
MSWEIPQTQTQIDDTIEKHVFNELKHRIQQELEEAHRLFVERLKSKEIFVGRRKVVIEDVRLEYGGDIKTSWIFSDAAVYLEHAYLVATARTTSTKIWFIVGLLKDERGVTVYTSGVDEKELVNILRKSVLPSERVLDTERVVNNVIERFLVSGNKAKGPYTEHAADAIFKFIWLFEALGVKNIYVCYNDADACKAFFSRHTIEENSIIVFPDSWNEGRDFLERIVEHAPPGQPRKYTVYAARTRYMPPEHELNLDIDIDGKDVAEIIAYLSDGYHSYASLFLVIPSKHVLVVNDDFPPHSWREGLTAYFLASLYEAFVLGGSIENKRLKVVGTSYLSLLLRNMAYKVVETKAIPMSTRACRELGVEVEIQSDGNIVVEIPAKGVIRTVYDDGKRKFFRLSEPFKVEAMVRLMLEPTTEGYTVAYYKGYGKIINKNGDEFIHPNMKSTSEYREVCLGTAESFVKNFKLADFEELCTALKPLVEKVRATVLTPSTNALTHEWLDYIYENNIVTNEVEEWKTE